MDDEDEDKLEEQQSEVEDHKHLAEDLSEHLSCAVGCETLTDFYANVKEAISTIDELRAVLVMVLETEQAE